MYKATANAQQFMERRGNFSTHGGRNGSNFLGIGENEQMTPDQIRDALLRRHQQLDQEIICLNMQLKTPMPFKNFQTLKEKRVELGLEKKKIAEQLTIANAKIKRRNTLPDLGDFIIEICKAKMTRPEWKIVLDKAVEQHKAAMMEYEKDRTITNELGEGNAF